MEKRKYDLVDRLVEFVILISEVLEKLPNSKLGVYLEGQMIRSAGSSALHYGEAQSAESPADFIHKIKVVMKELRETNIGLKIIDKKKMLKDSNILRKALKEIDELLAIFSKSIETAKKNAK